MSEVLHGSVCFPQVRFPKFTTFCFSRSVYKGKYGKSLEAGDIQTYSDTSDGIIDAYIA